MTKKIVVLLLAGIPCMLLAHPHVFIISNINFIARSGHASHLEIRWEFDAMFSAQVLQACDRNGNRRIDRGEVQLVRKGFFRNLKHSNYFLNLWVNNVYVRNPSVSGFTAFMNGEGKIVFRFLVGISPPSTGKVRIKAMNNDPSIFVAFMSRPGTSRIKGPLPGGKTVNNANCQFQLTYGK